jgi:glutamine amidotransferase
MVHPIIDEYYNYNPYHSRSSKFVQEKGLVTNEKGSNGTPAVTPGIPNSKKSLLHETITSNLVPSMHARSPSSSPAISPAISPSLSPALCPATETIPRVSSPLANINNLSLAPTTPTPPTKPQELGNTKKKRKSLTAAPDAPQPVPDTNPPTRSYGDPLKIRQYFPEL